MAEIKPFLSKEQERVLQRIQEGLPKEYKENLMVKEYALPTVREVVKRALADKNAPITKEKREQLQHLWDSGYLDKKVEVTDKKTEKKIGDYYTQEIKKAMERGELPKRDIKTLRRQYARKRGSKGDDRSK